jgi:hypothetical protein
MKRRIKTHLIESCVLLALAVAPSLVRSQEQSEQATQAADGQQPARTADPQGPAIRIGVGVAAPIPVPYRAVESPAASSPEVAALISELDSREYRVRERATRALLAAGLPALDGLLIAANGDRPEPADRAVWILQRLAQNVEQTTAEGALKRLAQLRDRPNLVAQAESELARIGVVACERRLKSLGAECSAKVEPIPTLGVYAPVFRVRLGPNWRGNSEDLRPLADLHSQQHIVLEGPAIDDTVMKLFESRPALIWMQLLNTKVSVAAIDSLKTRHPNADIYLKNRALMGVACQNHAEGAMVMTVEPGEAAHAAGVVAGDVITAIEGEKLPDFDRLTARIAQHGPGDKVQIEILRGEEKRTLEVTLGSWAEYEKRRGARN